VRKTTSPQVQCLRPASTGDDVSLKILSSILQRISGCSPVAVGGQASDRQYLHYEITWLTQSHSLAYAPAFFGDRPQRPVRCGTGRSCVILQPFGTPLSPSIRPRITLNPRPTFPDVHSMDAHSLTRTLTALALISTINLMMTTHASGQSTPPLHVQSARTVSPVADIAIGHTHQGPESAIAKMSARPAVPECDGQIPPTGTFTKILNRVIGQPLAEETQLCAIPPVADAADGHHHNMTK
jgi:hypothetical protein